MNLVAALQAALAVEHQAVYGYGVVGAYAPFVATWEAPPRDRLPVDDRLRAHKELRDRLTALLRQLGATPVASQPGYVLPMRVHTRATAAQLARMLERASQQAAWAVLSASGPSSPARRLMVPALAESAAWDAAWASDRFALASEPPVPSLPGQPVASQSSTTPTSSPS